MKRNIMRETSNKSGRLCDDLHKNTSASNQPKNEDKQTHSLDLKLHNHLQDMSKHAQRGTVRGQ